MLVGAMRFFDARGCASVALVARRTAVFFRVVNLQEFAFRMTGEGARVLVRFLVLRCHGGGRQLDRLANPHVAGFAAVHDIGFRDVDLQNFWRPGLGLVLQADELWGREAHHVIGDVGIQQFFLFVDRLDQFAELRAQLGALVFQVVISLFELVVILKSLFLTVRHFGGGAFFLVFVQIPLFALFCGKTSLGLDVIRGGAHIGAPVGENTLHGQNLRA